MGQGCKYLLKKEKITFRIIDGEAVILNLDTGSYYSLNETGTVIWKALIDGKTPEEITALLKQKYHSIQENVAEDLNCFIDDLHDEKLIEVK